MRQPRPGRTTAPQEWARAGLTLLLTAVVVTFAVRSLGASASGVVEKLRSAQLLPLAAAAAAAQASIVLIAAGWTLLLSGHGWTESRSRMVAWYFAGEVSKYLPGGFWAVVGRGELAGRARPGSRRLAYSSVTQSLLLLFSLAGIPALGSLGGRSEPLVLLLLAAAGLVALPLLAYSGTGTAVLNRLVLDRLQAPMLRLEPRTTLRVALAYGGAWFCIGLASWLLGRALSVDLGLVHALGATSAAWAVGFAIVFVPSGAGIRESVFVILLPHLDPEAALAIALAARFLFVAADVFGALIAGAWLVADRRSASGAPASDPSPTDPGSFRC